MARNDKVPELSAKEFEEFTKHGNVLIDFYAEWCMPCLMMSPVIDEMSDKFKGEIKFGKINIDDNQEIANKFNVASIPNFVLFKDGKPTEQFVGSMHVEDFSEKLKKAL